MRAGMDTAMKLRRAGLEPGRIARLTVLVGELSGLLPADGDLGEGDQVALLEPRSLLLGIARASRYAGVDNPRLWTTADVRAALEALGLEGRGPSVEELNGEGFPYSPYVLRRADLLTPAAMAASESAAPEAPSVPASPARRRVVSPDPRRRPSASSPTRRPSPRRVAASAAAGRGQAAQPVTRGRRPAPGAGAARHRRDRRARGRRASGVSSRVPSRDRGRAPARRERRPAPAPSVFPAAGPPPRTSVFAAPAAGPGRHRRPRSRGSPTGAESVGATAEAEEDSEEPGPAPAALLILAGLVVVVLLGRGRVAPARRSRRRRTRTRPVARRPSEAAPGPEVGAVQTIAGTGYTVEAVDVTDTCAGHAYGAVADFFGDDDCTGLSRALYSADVGGEAVVVSVVRVQMPDATAARDLRALADQNGSGNVSDLLREGVRYTGSPAELSGAEYASALSGPTVTIVEAAWADEDASWVRPRSTGWPARRWRWRSRPSRRADSASAGSAGRVRRWRRPRPCRPAGRPSPGGRAGRRCAASS